MGNNNNCCRLDCTPIAVGISIIIGIIATFLYFNAVIIIAPVFYWVVFGIAVVYLGLTLIFRQTNTCGCTAGLGFIVGVLGTILTSLILLAVTFAATSIIGAIFNGLLLFFFSLLI